MGNNIASKDLLIDLINRVPDNFTQVLRSKKNSHLYGNTFDYVNTTYKGTKFSEKLYKHIHGEKNCKKCGTPLTCKQFRSFFEGYMEEFCSKKCALHSTERTDHIKQTKLERYGDSSYNNLPKQQETMVARHGVKHNWSSGSSLREKCYATNEKLHGSRGWNNPEKYKRTMMEKYGVKHPSHDPDILDKIQKCRWKQYKLPSGREIKIQGYEHFALNALLQTHSEEDIITERRKMPKIFWTDDSEKSHRYYPDIFIKSKNKFVEVKSPWIWKLHKNLNLQKIKAVKSQGFEIDVLLFNAKGELLETYASQ